MANSEPIKRYLAAVKLLEAGDKEGAAESLTLAIGGEAPSPVIRHSIEKILRPGTLVNELMLELVASTITRR